MNGPGCLKIELGPLTGSPDPEAAHLLLTGICFEFHADDRIWIISVDALMNLLGAQLFVNTSWKNPSGEWHVGYKLVYELFTSTLTSRLKKERRKKWDEKNQEAIAEALKELNEFDQKHKKLEDAGLKRVREDVQNKVDFLRKLADSYDDRGPVVDAVVWNDGDTWRVALDTQTLEDDDSGIGKLADFVPMANYRTERKYGIFSKLDACSFVTNVYNEGNVLSIVTDCSPHGTHVAGIATAFHPNEPLLNGVAPGAQIISCKIGDARLGSMETGTGLIRALIAAVEHKCDLINMSFGEPTLLPDYGCFVDLVNEVVNKHHLIFISSAGNSGPALSTVGAPGGTTSSILGIGAYVSPAMAAGAHCVVEPPPEGLEYTWGKSSRGPTTDGDLGVCVSAPGGAVAPVPTWTLQRRMLMNGTSMASPSACGGVALLISAMKAEGITVSPYTVRKALENTAVPVGDLPEDKLSTGHGLMQVDSHPGSGSLNVYHAISNLDFCFVVIIYSSWPRPYL
ncbi:tripeptidyl-peptidase II Tpp2 [Asimina triloba]